MNRLAELRAVGSAARQLPGALLRRGCETRLAVAEHTARYPVVLVHGYVGSESVWTALRNALTGAGFGYLVSLNYSCFATDSAEVSAELLYQARIALARTGAPRVHLVGHSMGGLIMRQALGDDDLADVTATAVTIASPHHGAPLARIAPGRCARIMHQRGHDVPAHRPGRPLRWLAYYSDADRIVPSESARLDEAGWQAKNVLVPGCGHLAMCRDHRLIRSLVSELIKTETPTVVARRGEPDPARALVAA